MRLDLLLVCTTLVFLGLPVASQAGNGPGRCKKDGNEIESSGSTDPHLLRDFAERCVRLNHVQVLGSHNSYHIQPGPSLDLLLQISDPLLPGCGGPGDPCPSELSLVWEYTHVPLDQQFSQQGVRQIELDVFLDPEEPTLFANPLGDFLVAVFGLPPDPENDPNGLLLDPGFKVLHVQDLDFRSSCLTLEACLQTIQQWSAAHLGHLPLTVLVELKEEPLPDLGPPFPPFVTPIPFEAEDLDDLDSLIRSVFPPGQLITPDDVRRRRPTLEKAVLKDGWPTLGEAAGRVLFALDNGGAVRDLYVEGHPSLRGRVLFTDSPPGEPEAAFMKRNDPVGSLEEIQDLVSRGYIVRTRSDADTLEARFGLTARRDNALASGAQFVSSDYPEPNPDFGTGYFVEIPGGEPARCNPLSAPPGCREAALEDLP
jgi:hypothetical protein